MAISQSEFNALNIGDTVYLTKSYPYDRAYTGVVSQITQTLKKVDVGNSSFSFYSPTRQRGEKFGGFNLVYKSEYEEQLVKVKKLQDETRLNNALDNVGKLRTSNSTGDQILMALEDAIAKAKNYFG
jgi:hypothetical protein